MIPVTRFAIGKASACTALRWHTIPPAARRFLATPMEAMMDEDVQALVFIVYFVANILVLYHVNQSRLLEDVD